MNLNSFFRPLLLAPFGAAILLAGCNSQLGAVTAEPGEEQAAAECPESGVMGLRRFGGSDWDANVVRANEWALENRQRVQVLSVAPSQDHAGIIFVQYRCR